jgi:hypothetical protein
MSNGSSLGAVRPFVNGQQQNGQSENPAFERLAAYLAEVHQAPRNEKPKPPPANLPIPRVKGRDILFRLLDVIADPDRPITYRHLNEFLASFMLANESDGQALIDSIRSHMGRGQFCFPSEDMVKSHRRRIKRYGHALPNGLQLGGFLKKADVERMRDTLHYDDKATAGFDHYAPSHQLARKPPEPVPTVGKPKPPKATKAKPAAAKATEKPAKGRRNAVADMAEEKAARSEEKPAKHVETFAKHFDWVNKIKAKPAARMILSEIIRNACGCPFTWVGNVHLGNAAQLSTRQVRRYLVKLETDGHITIRDYKGTWCKTGRIIFVNRLAQSAGMDPASIAIPEGRTEFWKFRARFNGQNKPKKPKAHTTTKAGIKADMSDYIKGSECPPGYDINVIRRDKGFSAPIGAEKTHSPNVDSTSPPRGVLPPSGVEGGAEPAPSATPAPKSEHEAAKAKATKTTRPPMDWPERNLPTVERESALARMVRLGRVTHLHPRWLDGLACWVVRHRTIDGQKVYIEPKVTPDGWIENTCDAVVVLLDGPADRRISQADFVSLLRAGPIVVPNPNGT